MKITLHATEAYTTYIVRAAVELDTDHYPELAGMSEEEALQYIYENGEEMKPTVEDDYVDNLWDELYQSDVIKEKITNEEYEVIQAD